MNELFGTRVMDKPEGMLRPVFFPSMARTGTKTGDGRLLEHSGRGVRELPRTIFFQFEQLPGHEGSRPVGRVDAVEFQDDGNIRGWGWLMDSDDGRKAAEYIATKTQFHNSVDLAEVKAKLDVEEEDGMLELLFTFTQWNIAATTFVGKPAFKDAHGTFDEMTAALLESDSELTCEVGSFEFNVAAVEELTAALATAEKVSWADFHLPEADKPTKIVVTEDGCVFGHLGLWDTPHRGYDGKFVRIPRPHDNYASFNQAGPLTELGQVETGPIFFLGGHPDHPIGNGDKHKAYGGVENSWCDVRVTAGRFGPWLSGRVRPNMDENAIYVARASRISGHWKGDELVAIVSVNVAGFNVPGTGLSYDSVFEASFDDQGHVLEMVASFPDWAFTDITTDEVDDELADLDEYNEELQDALTACELAVDTTPTLEMAAEAEQGLAWRSEFKRGGGTVALARARDIKNRKALSERTLRRMLSFFQRHDGDKKDKGWSTGEEGYPSAARINWALWGGDAGYGWVKGKLSALENEQTALSARATEIELLLLD